VIVADVLFMGDRSFDAPATDSSKRCSKILAATQLVLL
jgi:hypothetical protein